MQNTYGTFDVNYHHYRGWLNQFVPYMHNQFMFHQQPILSQPKLFDHQVKLQQPQDCRQHSIAFSAKINQQKKQKGIPKNNQLLPSNYSKVVARQQPKRAYRRCGEPSEEQKMKRIKKKEVDKRGKNQGHWTQLEKKRYYWFMQLKSKNFLERSLRRMEKIFKLMAVYVGSRGAQQCRSHHQKMQKKHSSFIKILSSLRQFYYGTQQTQLLRKQIQIPFQQKGVEFLSAERLSQLNVDERTQSRNYVRSKKQCKVEVMKKEENIEINNNDMIQNKYQRDQI